MEEAERRHKILRQKEEKDAVLMSKAANIGKIRRLAHAQAALRRERKEREARGAEEARERAEESKIKELDDKLRQKRDRMRREHERIAEEVRRAKFEQQGLGASAGQVEELKFLELRRGAEREIVERQTRAREGAEEYEATRKKLQETYVGHAKRQLKEKREFYEEYDRTVAEEKEIFERLEEEEMEAR